MSQITETTIEKNKKKKNQIGEKLEKDEDQNLTTSGDNNETKVIQKYIIIKIKMNLSSFPSPVILKKRFGHISFLKLISAIKFLLNLERISIFRYGFLLLDVFLTV